MKQATSSINRHVDKRYMNNGGPYHLTKYTLSKQIEDNLQLLFEFCFVSL